MDSQHNKKVVYLAIERRKFDRTPKTLRDYVAPNQGTIDAPLTVYETFKVTAFGIGATLCLGAILYAGAFGLALPAMDFWRSQERQTVVSAQNLVALTSKINKVEWRKCGLSQPETAVQLLVSLPKAMERDFFQGDADFAEKLIRNCEAVIANGKSSVVAQITPDTQHVVATR